MLDIYFKHRKLSICRADELPVIADDRLLMHPATDCNFAQIPYMMESSIYFRHLMLVAPDGMSQEELVSKVLSGVKVIRAAGGLVQDEAGNQLMIYRNGVWDLPKGKQEEGEDITVTALREVQEESGVKASLGELLTVTWHSYRLDGNLIVKSTRWYRMFAPKNAPVKPQTEEGIEKCEWVTPEDLDYRLANTYPSVIDVFESAKTR